MYIVIKRELGNNHAIYVNYLLNEIKFTWYIKCLVWWVNYYRIYGEIKVANKLSKIYSRLIYQSRAGPSKLSADHWNTSQRRINLSFLGNQYQPTIEIMVKLMFVPSKFVSNSVKLILDRSHIPYQWINFVWVRCRCRCSYPWILNFCKLFCSWSKNWIVLGILTLSI